MKNKDEKLQVNFYKLDKTKPFSYLGADAGAFSVLIVIGIFFGVITSIALGAGHKAFFKDTITTVIPAVMLSVTFALLIAGICITVIRSKKRKQLNNVVENCVLTDGVITGIVKRKIQGSSKSYETEIRYSFTDCNMTAKNGSFKTPLNVENEFFEGQNVLIAFNDSESFIMKKYTLIEEDKGQLQSEEAAREEDRFAGLSSELVDYIDLSQPIKPLEYISVLRWLAIALCVMLVIYSVPIGIWVVPQFFDGGILAVMIIGCIMTMLIPAILIVSIICLLYKYFKAQKRVKKVLGNNPYFTWGEVYFSEKTYGNSSRKKVLYCYIDKWEERHIEELKGVLATALIHPRTALIAYTADGSSVPLGSYTFTQDAIEGWEDEEDETETEE